ncbi:MAG: alkaline phosphatase [Planctomycetales bacterium]|nr:alkaline phosphatase [Planctomycetales bacterium]
MKILCAALLLTALTLTAGPGLADDPIADLQAQSARSNKPIWGHWGPDATKYSSWTSHSNRLIPVYTFGGDLRRVSGAHSVYRDAAKLTKLYGRLPSHTVNPAAEYCDQTDVYRLQKWAVEDGKKRIILFVFDGMDWQTTRAAAIAKSGKIGYEEGRGRGLAFQDYSQTKTDFGYFVTSPHNNGTSINVDRQIVTTPGGKTPGGYDVTRGGSTPWATTDDRLYLIGKSENDPHAYTDSAASAVSMCSGIKTYNDAINVDFSGREVEPIARTLQADGFAVGVVTSVPISHATPASAYATNVNRNDYQDLTRDLLGLPSVFHPGGLPGVDVLIGAGWGETREKDGSQGENFVPGNRYLTAAEQASISVDAGGRYVVAERTPRRRGSEVLSAAAQQAIAHKQRLFGYFGVAGGHLPYQTADGYYDPVESVGNPTTAKAEFYTAADIRENVDLAAMAVTAAEVLQARSDRWWLMVEAGDVDWANHSNNIDNSIGAVLSGDQAFQKITQWIETHGGWEDTLLILTADHGHYLHIQNPALLIP